MNGPETRMTDTSAAKVGQISATLKRAHEQAKELLDLIPANDPQFKTALKLERRIDQARNRASNLIGVK